MRSPNFNRLHQRLIVFPCSFAEPKPIVKQIWNKLSLFGTAKVSDPLELQSLMLTNRISLIAAVLMLIIGVLLGQSQWNREPYFVLLLAPLFLTIPLLMRAGRQNFARLLLCFFIPVLVLGMSVISKIAMCCWPPD
jgi:hypothetical protein